MTVTIDQQVTFNRIADLLTSAFEGGSNYWIDSIVRHDPERFDFAAYPDLGRERGMPPQTYLCDVPLNAGGSIDFILNESFDADGTVKYTLDLERIKRGLQTFLKGEGFGTEKDGTVRRVPRHAASFLSESEDAETGDVFLQICLFGEVVFG
jgi:hypothetical protein